MAETPPQPFRDVLSAALEASGTGQEELARRIGQSGAAVSQWLRKGDMPDLAVIFKIEDALELRLGTLIRHASPEVWVIIETKTTSGRSDWRSMTWERKWKETLIEMPLRDRQRATLKEIVQGYLELNALKNSPGRGD